MKLNKTLSEALLRLLQGDAVPGSTLGAAWLGMLQTEGMVTVVSHGSRRTVKAMDRERFLGFLQRELDLPEKDSVWALLEGTKIGQRSELVHLTGDSKFASARSMFGFLVNSYEPVPCFLKGSVMTVCPPDGTFIYISDFQAFCPAPDVTVVGIENAENFRLVRRQKSFFEKVLPGHRLLFVSRYPQNGDLVRWVKDIPNAYYHFGDLDLAGVNIFLTEFYAKIGPRARFIIPPDARERLLKGSTARYDDQYQHYRNMQVADIRVQTLVDLIHECHRGYDQEGFIE